MATNTEMIRKASEAIVALEQQIAHLRVDVNKLEPAQDRTDENVNQLDKRLTVLEREFAEFRRLSEDRTRSRLVVAGLIIAMLGLAVSLGNMIFGAIRK